MVKAKKNISINNDGVEETKTDPITQQTVHSADEFHKAEPKKVKMKKDGSVDKRSVKLEVKKDLIIEQMAEEIKALKHFKTAKEIKADEKAQKKADKENAKLAKAQEKERKRVEKENKKLAMEQILAETNGKGARITKSGKVDMRGRSLKCREHQQNVVSTMREALRKSYMEKAKKHVDESDEEPDFEIVPVPKLEMIVDKVERLKEREKEIDYKALYEAQAKTYESDFAREMATAKKVGHKKRIQEKILSGIL